MPYSLKILSLFLSSQPDLYDQLHYKYLRAKSIKFSTLNLSFLNQVLADLAPHLFGPSKGQQPKKDSNDIIVLPPSEATLPSEAD